MRNPFSDLTKKERILYFVSVFVVSSACVLTPLKTPVIMIACLVGVTALIFVAKGYVFGQILTVVFALLYGIVSYELKYYGEMITYLGMSAPIALMSVYSWIKHPYKETKEVEVYTLCQKDIKNLLIYAFLVTFLFYFILKRLDTSEIVFSTISVTTSFLACYLTYLRSPYYALAYAMNDIILIILWVMAGIKDSSFIPMIFCFIMFFVNDFYGFINWQRMRNRQNS